MSHPDSCIHCRQMQARQSGELAAKAVQQQTSYLEDLPDWSARAAQELQDFLDAARESGCDLPSVELLIGELDSMNGIYAAPDFDPEMEDADGFAE